jgi:hypothetical protein
MKYSEEKLNDVFDRTDGRCHLCHRTLTFSNYGELGARGAWEVEHSIPKALGGSDHLNNLYPSCVPCNRSKGVGSTRTVRARSGKSRAPFSVKKLQSAKQDAAIAGAFVGGLVGSLFGRKGAVIGAFAGLLLGHAQDPENWL